jgi:hypothetical protein
MIDYYATHETVGTSLVGMVANKVTSAVFSLAKSFWTGNTNDALPPSSNRAIEEKMQSLDPVLSLLDTYRKIICISLSPPSPMTGRPQLAGLSDSLGRVMLMDLDEGQIVRMWKGLRSAQLGWLEIIENNSLLPLVHGTCRKILLFVIYSPKRGILEVYRMWNGGRVCSLNIGAGCTIVNAACHALGQGSVYHKHHPNPAQCFIITSQHEVKRLNISFDEALGYLFISKRAI